MTDDIPDECSLSGCHQEVAFYDYFADYYLCRDCKDYLGAHHAEVV